MIKRVLYIFVFIVACSVFGQNYDKHRVENGETISQIAQKYNVTPYAIYQLNPDAQSGLNPSSILLIPKKSVVSKAVATSKTHLVETKETLFGIAKKYAISDEALKQANPNLEKEGLQIGQILTIPTILAVPAPKVNEPTPEKVVYHEVLPKETKYSIAKLYGTTIEELEKRNPEIIPSLSVGYQLIIKGNAPKKEVIQAVEPKNETTKSNSVKTIAVNYVNYAVKPKETLYSLSKKIGLSQDELLKLNPVLVNGVEIGTILKVPSIPSIPKETKKVYTTLSKNNDVIGRKKLALLLPFNIAKMESDIVNTPAMRLKKSKFLNMTLDFYSGALMAIDSAKAIGLPVDVSIFDSQETKCTSNIANIVQENNLQVSDAIIGPFYQNNLEISFKLVGKNSVPMISPLSKDIGNVSPNLYKSIPNNEVLRTAMFDYMRVKGGNIIAVVDKKKESVRQYIQTNQKGVQFAAMLPNGELSVESLKSLFVKNKTNYVVMETSNTRLIKWTINTMMGAMANFKVQLVILEPNETLDTDEINFEYLTKLKLMYPSITRENESPEAKIFEKEYRKDNKISPSTYATRGFDLTFDTIMRLSQGNTFQETADAFTTEQVDNKFEYYKKEGGGYTNKGIYILYYDTDLTIKEAK